MNIYLSIYMGTFEAFEMLKYPLPFECGKK